MMPSWDLGSGPLLPVTIGIVDYVAAFDLWVDFAAARTEIVASSSPSMGAIDAAFGTPSLGICCVSQLRFQRAPFGGQTLHCQIERFLLPLQEDCSPKFGLPRSSFAEITAGYCNERRSSRHRL